MQFTLHPAAVQASVVLIRDEEYRKLLELVQELRKENGALQEEIAELRRRLGLNSTNSSNALVQHRSGQPVSLLPNPPSG